MGTPAAARREVISIQQRNLIDNGRGGRTRPQGGPEWIDVATGVRAEIIPLRGKEALEHLVERSMQLYRVTICMRAGVTTSMRLMWGVVPLNIKSSVMSADRRDLVMTAEAGVPT